MTLEEASQKANDAWSSSGRYGESIVAVLVAFGLLKLDEPKSIERRVIDALWANVNIGPVATSNIMAALDAAGLKVVER